MYALIMIITSERYTDAHRVFKIGILLETCNNHANITLLTNNQTNKHELAPVILLLTTLLWLHCIGKRNYSQHSIFCVPGYPVQVHITSHFVHYKLPKKQCMHIQNHRVKIVFCLTAKIHFTQNSTQHSFVTTELGYRCMV